MEEKPQNKVLIETGRLLGQNFGPEQQFLAAVAGGREELVQRLAEVIGYLLANEPERLVQIMYRIDIAEPAFRDALTMADPPVILAGLVVDRMIQKAHSRIRYRETGEV